MKVLKWKNRWIYLLFIYLLFIYLEPALDLISEKDFFFLPVAATKKAVAVFIRQSPGLHVQHTTNVKGHPRTQNIVK